MSWSIIGTAHVSHKNENEVEAKIDILSNSPQSGHGELESIQAMAQVKEVSESLLKSGKFGFGKFTIEIHGHSNPNNRPVLGYSNDYICINIYQKEFVIDPTDHGDEGD